MEARRGMAIGISVMGPPILAIGRDSPRMPSGLPAARGDGSTGTAPRALRGAWAADQAAFDQRPSAARPLSRARSRTMAWAFATFAWMSCDQIFSAADCIARP